MVGDLVSIKEPFAKPLQYPLGIVKSMQVNELGECISAKVMKGNKQVVNKHPNDIILLTRFDDSCGSESDKEEFRPSGQAPRSLPPRKAKDIANQRLAKHE